MSEGYDTQSNNGTTETISSPIAEVSGPAAAPAATAVPVDAHAEAVSTSQASDVPVAAAVLISQDVTNSTATGASKPLTISDDQNSTPERAPLHFEEPSQPESPGHHITENGHIAIATVLDVEMDGELQQQTPEPTIDGVEAVFFDEAMELRRKKRRIIIGMVAIFILTAVAISIAVGDIGGKEEVPLSFQWSSTLGGLPAQSARLAQYGTRDEVENLEECVEFCHDETDVVSLGLVYFSPKELPNPYDPVCTCYRFVPCVNFLEEGAPDGIVLSATPRPRVCDSRNTTGREDGKENSTRV